MAAAKKSMVNFTVRSKEDLARFQMHPVSGKPFTFSQFYLQKKGGVLAIGKFQTELSRVMAENIINNIITREVLDIANSDELDPLEMLFEKLNNYPLTDIIRDSALKDEAKLDGLIKGIAELGEKVQRIREQEEKLPESASSTKRSLRRKKNALVKDFVEKQIYRKGLVMAPEELLPTGEKERYEASYKKFVDGFEVGTMGRKEWQLGWNDAQKMIRDKIKDLTGKVGELEAILDKHPYNNLVSNLDKISGADLRAAMKNPQTSRVVSDHNKQSDVLKKMIGDLIQYKELSDSIEKFRNYGEGFEPELWQNFLADHTEIKKGGITYSTVAPKQDKEYGPHDINYKGLPPYAKLVNDLAWHLGVTVVDNGAKTPESTIRKLEDPRFKGNPSEIYDSFRLTLAVSSMKGLGFLLKNIKDYANRNDLPCHIDRNHIYPSFLFATTVNIGIKVEIDGKEYMRIGEIKVIGQHQMAVKPVADKMYDIRRLISRDIGKGVEALITMENSSRADISEILHKTKTLLDNNDNVKALAAEWGLNFKKSMRDIENHQKGGKGNEGLQQLHADLTQLERLVFLSALSKEDKRIRQHAFNSFYDQYDPPEGRDGKKKSPKFNGDDYDMLKLFIPQKELKAFEKELMDARGEPYLKAK